MNTPQWQIEQDGVLRPCTQKEARDFLKANPDFGFIWDYMSTGSVCTVRKLKKPNEN